MNSTPSLHTLDGLQREIDALCELSKNPDTLEEVRKRRAAIRNVLLGRVVVAHKPLRWVDDERDGLRQLTGQKAIIDDLLKKISCLDVRIATIQDEAA